MMDQASRNEIVSGAESPVVSSLAERYRGRGVARVLRRELEDRIEREREEISADPGKYLISTASRAELIGMYRRGKDNMSTDDLLDHFRETHEARTKDIDFSQTPAADEAVLRGDADKTALPAVRTEAAVSLTQRITAVGSAVAEDVRTLKHGVPKWFMRAESEKKEEFRFPFAAFAAILAVAVSLMLIVASSVMVILGKSAVSTLDVRVSREESAIARIRSELNSTNDLFSIRNVAMEEFGMVDAEYVRSSYLSLSRADSVTVYGRGEPETVGLSALMSALGSR